VPGRSAHLSANPCISPTSIVRCIIASRQRRGGANILGMATKFSISRFIHAYYLSLHLSSPAIRQAHCRRFVIFGGGEFYSPDISTLKVPRLSVGGRSRGFPHGFAWCGRARGLRPLGA